MTELIDQALEVGNIYTGILIGAAIGGNMYLFQRESNRLEFSDKLAGGNTFFATNLAEFTMDGIMGGKYDPELIISATTSAFLTYNAMEKIDEKYGIGRSTKWDELDEELEEDIEEYRNR